MQVEELDRKWRGLSACRAEIRLGFSLRSYPEITGARDLESASSSDAH